MGIRMDPSDPSKSIWSSIRRSLEKRRRFPIHVFPFNFSEGVIGRALKLAKEHVDHYYQHHDYDEEALAKRSSFSPNSIVEITRKQLLNSKEKALRTSGIYLIVHENGQTVYVGLAADFHSRFTKGMRKHSEECESDCGHWGHFAVATSGAAMVGLPDGECRYFILENIDYDGFGISQAEIDWYYLFRTNGWNERKSDSIKKITNAIGSLGVKGNDSSPCISCNIATAELIYFPTQRDAAEANGSLQGVISDICQHKQNQAHGYTYRNPTIDEINAVPSRVLGEGEVTWTDNEGKPIKENQLNRNSLMRWTAGPLSMAAIDHLRKYLRGSYDGSNKSGFPWVYWDSHYERWYWKAYLREFRECGVKRREIMVRENKRNKDFSSPREAAIEREEWIIKSKLMDINPANFDWKPPKK